MKTWLITGCSSGIGKGIAKAVLESGDQAIVTARNKDKVMDIVEAYPETALAISLDVCSQDNIKNAGHLLRSNPKVRINYKYFH